MVIEDFSCFAANECYAKRITYPEEKEHLFRGKFERDRDRIIYSKSFRCLNGKTQIFVTGYDDRARNRLTHTLEVLQIAKTIGNALNLNIALIEAIALGHDLGHTPFGHAGEKILNYIMNGCIAIKDFNSNLSDDQKGFKHNWQGIRNATDLEQYNYKYSGLNLTDYTLWGILNHTHTTWQQCNKNIVIEDKIYCGLVHDNKRQCSDSQLGVKFYDKYCTFFDETSFTIEGLIVALADEIAQRHHDLEDGLISGVITRSECVKRFSKIFKTHLSADELKMLEKLSDNSQYKEWTDNNNYFLNDFSRLMINLFVTKLVNRTKSKLNKIKRDHRIISNEIFYKRKRDLIDQGVLNKDIVSYSSKFLLCHDNFKNYLKKRILNSYVAQSMDGKATFIIKQLFKAYITNPQQLPDRTIRFLLFNYYLNQKRINKAKSVFQSHGIGFWRDKLEREHYKNDTIEYKNAVLRTICDFISSMTDSNAIFYYEILYEGKQSKNYYRQ